MQLGSGGQKLQEQRLHRGPREVTGWATWTTTATPRPLSPPPSRSTCDVVLPALTASRLFSTTLHSSRMYLNHRTEQVIILPKTLTPYKIKVQLCRQERSSRYHLFPPLQPHHPTTPPLIPRLHTYLTVSCPAAW